MHVRLGMAGGRLVGADGGEEMGMHTLEAEADPGSSLGVLEVLEQLQSGGTEAPASHSVKH